MMNEIYCLADDVTGGLDVAGSFFQRDYAVNVLLDGDVQNQLETSCTVKCLNSRHIPSEQSRLLLRKSLAQINRGPHQKVFLKVDSALRGNMLDDSTELARHIGNSVFIAPAFPFYGRTCIDGVYYVNGIPVNESELANDTAFHHTSAYLHDNRQEIVHIDWKILDEGYEALVKLVNRLGKQLISFDTRDENDLTLIAKLGFNTGAALVGSSGLARVLPKGNEKRLAVATAEMLPSLFVVGSLHSMSRKQRKTLEETGMQGIKMSMRDVGNKRAVQLHQSHVHDVLSCGDSIYVTSPDSYYPDSSNDVASSLGRIVSLTSPSHHLIIVGGETARATLKARDVKEVMITGEFEPGIPISQASTSNGRIYTKAGSFGKADTLVKISRSTFL